MLPRTIRIPLSSEAITELIQRLQELAQSKISGQVTIHDIELPTGLLTIELVKEP